MAIQLDQIRAAAERVASSFGMEVVDLEFLGNPKVRTLRVFLEKNEAERAKYIAAHTAPPPAEGDSPAGQPAADQADLDPLPSGVPVEHLSGVTHEDCSHFAQDFGTILDVEDLVPGADYTLEVSSPGLDRKLSTPRDFERFQGSLVKLQTREPIQNNRQWRGRLAAVTATELQLDLAAVKPKGKAKKAAAAEAPSTITIPLDAIDKANLLPDF